MNFSFVGMPGVGKTYLGIKVANLLSYQFVDTDELIEKKYSHPQDILLKQGEEKLLAIEREIMLALDLSSGRVLLSTAGSVIYSPEIMHYLKTHTKIVYLHDTCQNIYHRVNEELDRGIIGLKGKTFKELYYSRLPLYKQYSEITLDLTVEKRPEMIAHLLKVDI